MSKLKTADLIIPMFKRPFLYPSVILLVTALTLTFAWVGWLDSDDKNHLVGAYGWMNDFPYLAKTHAALRHTIAIPVGTSFRIFGVSEFSLILPNLLQYFATVLITWSFVRRSFGDNVSLLACALIATVPLFPIFASVVFTETTELFYLMLSFWFFHEATLRSNKVIWLIGAGLSAGLAWLTRETTAALLMLYAVLFLYGYGMPRKLYWIVAGAFLVVAGGEALLMTVLADNPLYRYEIVLGKQGAIIYKGGIEGEVFNRIGNVAVHPVIDPLLVLFANHEFSLLFYLSVPAFIWGWRGGELTVAQRNTLRLLISWAVIWFLFVSLVLTNLHQRYYTVCAYVAAIVTAAWLVKGLSPGKPRLAIYLSLTILCVNLLAIYIDNRNQLFGERSLVALLETTGEDVYTDPVTHRRALFFLENAGVEKRVHSTIPPQGSLFFYNPNRMRAWKAKKLEWPSYGPDADSQLIWERSEGRKISGILLERMGLDDYLPESIYRRLNQPNLPVLAYRKS